AGGRPHPPASDPDDQLRVHLRRAAVGPGDRGGGEQSHRNRHLGDRRNADREPAGDLLYPAAVRARSPRHARGAHGAAHALRAPRRFGNARVIRLVRTLPLALALAGCSLAPDYTRPVSPVPQSWPAGDSYLRQTEPTLPELSYRDVFRDVRLQALIDQALTNN